MACRVVCTTPVRWALLCLSVCVCAWVGADVWHDRSIAPTGPTLSSTHARSDSTRGRDSPDGRGSGTAGKDTDMQPGDRHDKVHRQEGQVAGGETPGRERVAGAAQGGQAASSAGGQVANGQPNGTQIGQDVGGTPMTKGEYFAAVEAMEHPATIVTAYFPLGSHSKHRESEYETWLQNFLNVAAPMILHTNNDTRMHAVLRKLRGNRPMKLVAHASVWDLPMGVHKDAYSTTQHAKDVERGLHHPELYAVWNSKPILLCQGAQENPFGSWLFVWQDAGGFRDARSANLGYWPSRRRVAEVLAEGDMVLVQVMQDGNWPYTMEQGPIYSLHVAGALVAGNERSVCWFSSTFRHWHDVHMQRGVFVGKEQDMYNAIFFSFPERFIYVNAAAGTMPQCGGWWFHYQPWFADEGSGYPGCPRLPIFRKVRKARQ